MKNKTQPFNFFELSFNQQDGEAAEWFKRQPDKGAYIKALILADKAQKKSEETKAFDLRIQQENQWNETFLLVREFRKEHFRLPTPTEEYKGVQIGSWLKTRLQKDKDRPDRMEKLQSLNTPSKWEQHYQ